MKVQRFAAALSLLICAAPAVVNASTASRAATACAQSLVHSLSADGATKPKFSFAFSLPGNESPMAVYYTDRFTFDLLARDPKSGMPVARAVCTARRDGTIVKFTSMAPQSGETRLASRF